MKRNIVESYSIEEAFRALNKKATNKVVESAKKEISDTIIRRALMKSKAEFEPIDGQISFDGYVETVAGDLYAKYVCGGDFSGAFLSAEEEAELTALETRVQTAANELLGTNYTLRSHMSESAKKVVESVSDVYTAIILTDTVVSIGDVDEDGDTYDTVRDEFQSVTLKATSDREAVEKIAKYVPIVLDEYDYSEAELIDAVNNAAFPVPFEDWNRNYYEVGDSMVALISLKRPDGTELATESEIQAKDVNDALRQYTDTAFYMPEDPIHDWGIKFESITIGKPLAL